MKQRIALLFALLLVGVGTVFLISPSQATEPTKCYDTVIDVPAHDEVVKEAHWQRYSWTGGPHESDDPPAFPSADWQPNVEGDPHGIGVAGPYFRSHGNSGNGDWFYLEQVPAETKHVDDTYKQVEVACEEETTPTPTEDTPTTNEVRATAPTFIDPTCSNNVQDYEVPKIDGIEYSVAEPREDFWPTITLVAIPEDGSDTVIIGQTDWSHTYPPLKTAADCKGSTPKPESPTVAPEAGLPNTGA